MNMCYKFDVNYYLGGTKLDKFIIDGNTELHGEVEISGAKNAAVAILPATLLVKGITTLENVPNISDVRILCDILNNLGAKVTWIDKHTLKVDSRNLTNTHAPLDKTSKFRASYYLLGALLSRCQDVQVGVPGGCKLGARPIDQHIKGFEALGAKVDVSQGKITATAEKLVGAPIYFDVVSVGATINLILAAVLANGTTVLDNVAKEPHIVDVANFLNSVGADIRGAGTDTIKINGVKELTGDHTYSIVPDQIETGTFMCAAIASHGDILIKNCIPEHMDSITAKIIEMGGKVEDLGDALRVTAGDKINAVNIKTAPYPGFPTDLQPQMGVCLSIANGTSIINEGIWESRFQYTNELNTMGARITAQGKTAVFEGVKKLVGAPIYATDLRAGAALLIAGIIADGQSELYNIHYIDRGYEQIEDKFIKLGTKITRISDYDDYAK